MEEILKTAYDIEGPADYVYTSECGKWSLSYWFKYMKCVMPDSENSVPCVPLRWDSEGMILDQWDLDQGLWIDAGEEVKEAYILWTVDNMRYGGKFGNKDNRFLSEEQRLNIAEMLAETVMDSVYNDPQIAKDYLIDGRIGYLQMSDAELKELDEQHTLNFEAWQKETKTCGKD